MLPRFSQMPGKEGIIHSHSLTVNQSGIPFKNYSNLLLDSLCQLHYPFYDYMVLQNNPIAIKPLFILLLSLIATIISVAIISQKTQIFPRAGNDQNKIFLGPSSLPAAVNGEPPAGVPTPKCTTDSNGCVSCCSTIEGENVCQNRSCPAYKPYRTE